MTDQNNHEPATQDFAVPAAPEEPEGISSANEADGPAGNVEGDKVGYKRPPKHSRFKPGQSGNPKGRRGKNPRFEIPSQVGKDFRNVGRTKVRIKTPAGPKNVTAAEAVVWSIYKDAIAGRVSQQRLVLTYLFQAFEANLQRRPGLKAGDALSLEAGELQDKGLRDLIMHLSKASTKT